MTNAFPASARWVCLLVLAGVGIGCAQAQPAATESLRLAERVDLQKLGAESAVVLHYHRQDGDYAGWNVWAWAPDQDGAAFMFEGEDDFGRYAIIPFREATDRVGFIVRQGEWAAKDVDQDRYVEIGSDGKAEAWLVSGDPRVFGQPDTVDLTTRLVGAFLDDDDTITLAATSKLSAEQAETLVVSVDEDALTYTVKNVRPSRTPAPGRVMYDVVLERPVKPEHLAKLTLQGSGLPERTVYARDVLNDAAYSPIDADLGYRYTPEATTFRTWSPVSDAVELLVFEESDASQATSRVAMKPSGHGLWEAEIPGDLHGSAYQLSFTNYGRTQAVPDIHAFAANTDSSRSVVLDLDRLKPDGWEGDTPPVIRRKTDEVIYEIHVRDFSIADDTCPPEHRGTYLGLIHENPGDPAVPGRVATGISHLKELGVTAVHLLPIHDFGNERHDYNWGYWTALFNVPEAMYATNPGDPASPIMDLRTAILGLHQNDLRVILDVVYNHTATGRFAEAYEATVPHYYFRTTPDGRQRNDAGTGNSIADERPMVRKHIVDSLAFWVEQYHVDGFRFDLLGTHQPETVAAIEERLLAIRPDLTLYGEPWTGGGPTYYPKGAQKGSAMSVFNDHLRNALRGGLDGTDVGFASGPGGDRDSVRRGVMGAIDDFTVEPTESINYASAHDNLTLWDKLAITAPRASDQERRAMQKLALGVVLTSQGVPFLHGASDFARTKGGEHNSYNKGDAVNAFDWERKAEYRDVFRYVAGLIAMRRAHPAFRMDDDALVREHLTFIEAGPLVAYTLDGAAVGDDWAEIVVAYNGEPTAQTLKLPDGSWGQAVNEHHAAAQSIHKNAVRGSVTVAPYSMVVLFR